MPQIFISYSRQDLLIAQQLEQAFEANGFSVWRDQESLYGGQQWPKAIGEAIAGCDYFLIAWSQHANTSHFVDLEWNIALALRKTIIPCLLDETPLPPSLSALNGVFLKDFSIDVSQILKTLKQTVPSSDPEHNAQLIRRLGEIVLREPEKVAKEAKILFSQQGWSVQGNVYQAAGNIHVTIASSAEKPEKKLLQKWQTWIVFATAIIALIVALLDFPEKITKIIPDQPTSHLRGLVKDSKGEPISEAIITVDKLPGQKVLTTTDGGFYIKKIPGQFGERVRVYVAKEGYQKYNEYITLPGPANIVLKK